jgi:hypothetical protein
MAIVPHTGKRVVGERDEKTRWSALLTRVSASDARSVHGARAHARDIVSLDLRDYVSNLPIVVQIETALAGFETERIEYTGSERVVKRPPVAHCGNGGGLALSEHIDGVSDTRRMTA